MSKERVDEIRAKMKKANFEADLKNDVILENGMSVKEIYENPDLWYMLEPPEEKKPVQSTADKMRALVRKRRNNGK